MSESFSGTFDPKGFRADDPGGWSRAKRSYLGRRATVTLGPEKHPKTQSQLGYYFDVIVPAFQEHCGEDSKDDMHRDLKNHCMPKRSRINKLTGEVEEYVPGLSECDKAQTSDYMDRVLREGALMGIPIPPPRREFPEER